MKKRLIALVLVLALSLSSVGCGANSGSSKKDTIKIGYINPTTGPLAGNGEGCDWAVKQITDYVKENPITVDGKQMDFEVIVYDSESDANKCSELTQKLIEEDEVDMIIAIQTPNTVIPVVDVAERYEVPCIASQAPIDPVANSREELTGHTFHSIHLMMYMNHREHFGQLQDAALIQVQRLGLFLQTMPTEQLGIQSLQRDL